MARFRWLVALIAAVLSAVPISFAQNSNSGEIRGTVTDSVGAVIPGVAVVLTDVQTGTSSSTTTNGSGLYDFPSERPGNYSMSFSKKGFRDLERQGITLDVTTIGINVSLEVGSETQRVVVTSAAPVLQTEQSDQELTITSRQVIDAPVVSGVWFNELTNIIPGVNGGGSQDASGQGVGINGTQGYMGSWLLEGSTAVQPRDNNASNNYPPLDAIGEVTINSANYGAQYGTGVAAFNVSLKSGTNRWHGSAFEFNQNDAYNALNYFTPVGQKNVLRWNEFGGSIGGPIFKNKLFFFFTYQRNPSTSPYVSIITVPTDAMRKGDFSAFSTPLYNPATTTCSGTGSNEACSRQPFANNQIGSIDPVAAAIQSYFPEPNVAGAGATNNYTVASSLPSLSQWYVGKVDYDLNQSNRLSGSVFYFPASLYYNPDALCPLGFDCTKSNGNYNLAEQITDTWTLSPQVVNEFRVGGVRELDSYVPANYGKDYPTKIGLQPAYGTNAPGNIFPNVTVNGGGGVGAIGIGSGVHSVLASGTYMVSDVVTLIRGKHTLKVGGELDKNYQNYTGWGDVQSGNFQFNGIATANFSSGTSTPNTNASGIPYADFLLGQVYGWYVYEYPETGARMWNLAGFVQDNYQLMPHLVLNLGLRYVRQSGWSEVENRFGTFDPTLTNSATETLGAILYGGQNGRNTIQEGVNEWAPRIGFSYAVDPLTVVRGSFGIFNSPRSAETYTDGALGLGLNPTGSYGYGDVPAFDLKTGPPAGSVIYPKLASLTNSLFNYQAVTYYPRHMPIQYYQEALLSIQHQFPGQILLDTSYVFTKGTHLNFERDINQVPLALLSQGAAAQPYPQYTSVQEALFDGRSNYNALQVRAEKRFSHGLSFLFNYSWSKTMDTGTSSGHSEGIDVWQNAYDVDANYGLSTLDTTNSITGSASYELPVGHGRMFGLNGVANQALGGWRVSSIFQIHGGIPFTPTIGTADLSNSQGNRCGCSYQWLPNVVGNPKVAKPSIAQWFNPEAFAQPAPNTFGDERRNELRGPAWRDMDLSLGKTFSLPEKVNFELRGDAFDVLNHPNFGQPNASVGSGIANSGTITTANTFRQIQVGGRFTF